MKSTEVGKFCEFDNEVFLRIYIIIINSFLPK